MIPQTIGREYDVGKIASVQCVLDLLWQML